MITRRRFLERGMKAGVGAALLQAGCLYRDPGPSYAWVNDVHSRLNRTRVAGTIMPTSPGELVDAVRRARRNAGSVSIAGARHAMGAQQFGTDALLIETDRMTGVIDFDPAKGEVEVAAGTRWPELVAELDRLQVGRDDRLTILQKQSGADDLSIGGALAANIHGRGLTRAPFAADVVDFTMVDPEGVIRRCARDENADLFRLAIGGYGLFGLVSSVRLRLAPRRAMERVVTLEDVAELPRLFDARIEEGYEFGDFQFATEPASDAFLQRGVFACYRPAAEGVVPTEDKKSLGKREWLELIRLAHDDRTRAFEMYAEHYRATSGQVYGSDELQFGTYVPDYHGILASRSAAVSGGTEMITELYVPRDALVDFMDAVREDMREHAIDLVYGTIRLIERDEETALAWARQPWACVIFNLHVGHAPARLFKAREDFRRLIHRALERDGSYYLTYHKWATRGQVLAAHPTLVEVLREKLKRDPRRVIDTDWHRHHRDMLADLV